LQRGVLSSVVRVVQEMNECVVEAMRFILAQNQAKPMVPVPTASISKVLKELNTRAQGVTKAVMARARVGFMRLGWDVVEIGVVTVDACFVLQTSFCQAP
jgi:hypothetical protein